MEKTLKLPKDYSIERVTYVNHSLVVTLDKDTRTPQGIKTIVPIRVIQGL